MAMVIKNNNAAMLALGELNKNTSALGKQLKKVSSGQRLNGAGDAPSDFSISEKMRVRIRALDQDERNVQNGASLLRVAEGGIQSQIEIMKTIKQKVIDADNDTNTDLDRMTIQKEIDQGYRQIEDIAWETNYNGKRLLVGDMVYEKVRSWVVNGTSSLLPGSDEMNIINAVPDVYPTLNGVEGPFDLFTPSKIESATLDRLGFSPSIQYAGGVDNVFTFGSSFTTVDDFDGGSLEVSYRSRGFVLTKNPNDANMYGGYVSRDTIGLNPFVSEIDISGCSSVQDVLAAIQAKMPDIVTGYGVDENGSYYLKTTDALSGVLYGHAFGDVIGADSTGLFSGDSYFAGGEEPGGVNDDDPDSTEPYPGKKATWSLSGIQANTGITVYEEWGRVLHGLQFVEGANPPTYYYYPQPYKYNGVQTVGVDYEGSITLGSLSAEMKNGILTITAKAVGTTANSSCFVKDGIEQKKYEFLLTKSLDGTNASKRAAATVDVSSYDDVETLISDLKGKAITFGLCPPWTQSSMFESGYPEDYSTKNEYYNRDVSYYYVEFIDSGSSNPMDGMYKFPHSKFGDAVVDLNSLRAGVEGGKTIAEAFWECCKGQTGGEAGARIQEATNSGGQTIGIKVVASSFEMGEVGNQAKLFLTQNQLRSYTLDYGKWFTDNPDKSNPDFLNGKGFRAYCASCANEWFNFCFYTGELPEGRPQNADPESEDIKPIYIDVSGVTDAASLVQAIVDQATPYLEGASEDYNHFMRLMADGDKLIIYDERRFTDSYLQNAIDKNRKLLYDYQWDSNYNVGGAKIADGVWDNVVIGERDIYVKDLVIHHTDHASQNIHVKIPQTTMDHLFAYKAGTREWSEFNVMTAASREELLGNKVGYSRSGKYIAEEEEGLLDHALNYLTAANCLVGAQISRLEMTEANIVTSRESTTSSESTIRDADMAKEMTEYTKANVLAQAAQSMLAQANQNSSIVLSLLQ